MEQKIDFLEKYLLEYYNVMLPYCYEYGGILTSVSQLHDFEYAWENRTDARYNIFERNYCEVYYMYPGKETPSVLRGGIDCWKSVINPLYKREYSFFKGVLYNFSGPIILNENSKWFNYIEIDNSKSKADHKDLGFYHKGNRRFSEYLTANYSKLYSPAFAK